MAVMTKEQWRRQRRRQRMIKRYAVLCGFAVILVLLLLGIVKLISLLFSSSGDGIVKEIGGKTVKQSLLTKSDYARPGTELAKIENIVIHYVGVAGTTASDKRNYYETLKDTRTTTESVHFIIDLDGTIVQCIPVTEVACASKAYNKNSIAIEYCNTGNDGSMSAATYQSLIQLVAYLCDEYDITQEHVLRHYDITQNMCPYYFVENPDAWAKFHEDVEAVIAGKTVTVTSGPIANLTPKPDEPTGTPEAAGDGQEADDPDASGESENESDDGEEEAPEE